MRLVAEASFRRKRSSRAVALSLVFSLAGCGDDEDPSPSARPTRDGGGDAAASGGATSGTGGSGTGGQTTDAGGGTGSTRHDAGNTADAQDAQDASPRSVTLTTYLGLAQSNLAFVAGQDGDGPWTVLPGGGGRYELPLTTERYSFVIVCAPYRVVTLNFTVQEWPEPVASCFSQSTYHDVSGVVAGLGAGERARVQLGDPSVDLVGPDISYLLPVPEGTWDALVTHQGQDAVDRVIIERDVRVSGELTKNFDLAGQGFAPVTHPVLVTGALPSEATSTGVSFRSHRGTVAWLKAPSGTAPFIPESHLSGNDVHLVAAHAIDESSGTLRSATACQRAPGDVTLALPPPFGGEVSVAETSPQVRFGAAFEIAGTPVIYNAIFAQASPEPVLWWSKMSAGWLGSAARATYTFPDFSDLPGWDPAYAPKVGVQTDYELAVLGSSRGLALDTAPRAITTPGLDGLVTTIAQKSGQIIP